MTELSDMVIDTVTELPQASKQSADCILRRIYSKSDYGKETCGCLINENYMLADFLGNYFQDEVSAGSALYMGIAIYGMLKLEAKQLETKLPTVTPEAVRKVLLEYQHSKRDDYIFGILFGIRKRDPVLAEFIHNFSEAFDNPMPAFEGGLLVYRFMEKQAEMNKLKIN